MFLLVTLVTAVPFSQCNAWALKCTIHTVQFSNHTQYQEGWTGRAFSADDISELVRGLGNIGALEKCQAVLTGYQGSAEQCLAVEETVSKVKQANPDALYV